MSKPLFAFLLFVINIHLSAQFVNVKVNSPLNTTGEEVSIAINVIKQQYVAAGSNINYFYVSDDSGKTWSQSQISSPFGVWGDPCLIYDGLGNLYYSHLSKPSIGNPPTQGYFLDRIVVQKSTDNGIIWNNGASVGLDTPKQQDKDWLAADLSSPKYKNNIYAAWTEFDKYGSTSPKDSTRILFSRSTDHGDIWSAPVRVSDKGGNCLDSDSTVEGAVPCIGPNGEVYVSWSGPLGIMFDKSLDGGQTFGKDIFVTSQPGGWDFNISGIYRANGFPVTACDTSRSLFRGNIYVLWGDKRNGENNADVFIIKSTDKGETWGKVIKVNNDNSNREQFLSWLSIDQTTGNIYVVFYDRRNTRGDTTDVFLAVSNDGGNTFNNFEISDSSFVPNAKIFFGDYINIAAYNKRIYPIWMRMDNSLLSIWTALVTEPIVSLSVNGDEPVINNFYLFQNYPDPFNPSTSIKYSIPYFTHVSLKIYNILGEEIATLVDGDKNRGIYNALFNTMNYSISSGVYFYRLSAGGKFLQKKMIILK